MKRNGGTGRYDSSSDAKKAKMDDDNAPTKVLFIHGLPHEVTEGEIVQLGLPFGRMTAMILNKKKNQAFLEMADVDLATSMLNYYAERPPKIGGRNIRIRYSNYDHLKMEDNSQNAGCFAALKAAEQLLEDNKEAKTVLRIIIDNMIYPITIEILHKIFSKYGEILRIVTFTKNDQFHAFVEYNNAVSAAAAKNSLNGENIYNGCCTLRVDFSKLDQLKVKFNNDKTWDYTTSLQPGDGGKQTNDGLMGSGNVNRGGSGRQQANSRDRSDFTDKFGENIGAASGIGTMNSGAGRGVLGRNIGGLSNNFGSMGASMALMGNMGSMGGNVGTLGGMASTVGAMSNLSAMGGNLGMLNMTNMGAMGGSMGMGMGMMGNMAGISQLNGLGGEMLGNMVGMAGNMGAMGNSLANRMGGGNVTNTGNIPSLLGNIPGSLAGNMGGLNGVMGGGMMAGMGNVGGMAGVMGGNLLGAGIMGDMGMNMNLMGANATRNFGGMAMMGRGAQTAVGDSRGVNPLDRLGGKRDVDLGRKFGGRSDNKHDVNPTSPVVLVSRMNEERITPDNIFTLFGVYGDVMRVKILFNKKDSALVEFANPAQAACAIKHLDRVVWWGQEINVSPSKHQHIMTAKEGVSEAWLTKDFSTSKLHRFKNPHSKNINNIYPPSATLHLSNIPPDTSEESLRELFGSVGHVEAFRFFAQDQRMAYVKMGSVEDAISALVELHNYEFSPQSRLRVSFTQSKIRD